MLKPDNDNILVELQGEYKNIAVVEKQGHFKDTKTKGVCVAVSNVEHKKWLNKTVFFKPFEDDVIIDDKYALIEGKFVKGYIDATE